MITNLEDLSDFEDFQPTAESGDLKALGELVQRADRLKEWLKQRDEKTKEGADLLKDILEVQIPELMSRCGLTKDDTITFGGITVTLKDDVYCNVPSQSAIDSERDDVKRQQLIDRREKGLRILEQKAPSLIKRKYEISFDRDSQDEAQCFEQKLAEMENPPELVKGLSVHPSTLAKWVKEVKATAYNFSDEEQYAFGIFPKKVAKISK